MFCGFKSGYYEKLFIIALPANNLIMNRKLLPVFIVFLISIFNNCEEDNDNPSNLTATDYDGNVYKTVQIGNQIWMAENLKTIKYNDGTAIPLITDDEIWNSLNTPGYCWYDNDQTTYKNKYGALYNWYTVDTKKLCPAGWHIPSNDEWITLIIFAGGDKIAGGKLKEAGIIHWNSPNFGADNETGFTALPGGTRNDGGIFTSIGYAGFWWSSNEFDTNDLGAWGYDMDFGTSWVYEYGNGKYRGRSVRCIKD